MLIEISLYYATTPGEKNQEGGAFGPPFSRHPELDSGSLVSNLLPLTSNFCCSMGGLGGLIEGSSKASSC